MLTRAFLAMLAATLVAAPAAVADPAAGISGTSDLAIFDTANPAAVTTIPITGLQTGTETVIGLDFRPATGQLFAITVPTGAAVNAPISSYFIDPATGAATFVATIPAATVPGAADTPTGVDFNPVVDRLRVLNSLNENFRVNPNNGTLSGNDTDLTYTLPATGPVTAVAYDRNIAPGPPGTLAPPGTLTTLYGIDVGSDRLVTIGGVNADAAGGPNGGTVRSAGTLTVAVDDGTDAGFDIAPNGSAFASLIVGGQPGLYRVNLLFGAATLIGPLPVALRSLTITGPDNCPGVAGDDQADRDNDGVGDVCDDSDSDGVLDSVDKCPKYQGTPPSGCDKNAPKITFKKTAKKLTFKRFFKGVSTRIKVNEAASLDLALLIGTSSASAAKAGDLVLAEKHLKRSAKTRKVRLKPKRSLFGRTLRLPIKVRLRVTATDAAGNSRTKTKKIRVAG
jgi:hypothetical protein